MKAEETEVEMAEGAARPPDAATLLLPLTIVTMAATMEVDIDIVHRKNG